MRINHGKKGGGEGKKECERGRNSRGLKPLFTTNCGKMQCACVGRSKSLPVAKDRKTVTGIYTALSPISVTMKLLFLLGISISGDTQRTIDVPF